MVNFSMDAVENHLVELNTVAAACAGYRRVCIDLCERPAGFCIDQVGVVDNLAFKRGFLFFFIR
ncbi:hypothetical protein SDC9_148340 [bioreactor metagenome]|uniref:Uncharacterized protein n=1 Tax=bioreactor metagenome TaxID=1076179 RepID=A0A645EHB4_9ZZZZ